MLRDPALLIHDQARLCRISTLTTLLRVETMTLDAVDRQIIHILTIEPRASFRTIAAVIGTSDQTAARRYRRLEESAGLRVLGVPDGLRLGWTDWFLRLQTTPGGADSLAEALARRPTPGGFISPRAGPRSSAPSPPARGRARCADPARPARQPPRRADLRAQHSARLRPGPVAAGGPGAVRRPAGAEFRVSTPPDPPSRAVLLAEDEPLLKELARDGRASCAALAAAIHWHESTVRRRIDELRQSGA